MIKISHNGNFDKTDNFLRKMKTPYYRRLLEKYAQEGVVALSSATPVDTGKTANSWGYEIIESSNSIKVIWTNSNFVDGVPIAILIQYGHANRDGSHVEGVDFINPAMRPIFDKIADNIWREVSNL